MKIAICQINPVVGDINHNLALVLEKSRQAKDAGHDLAIFPELALAGYPPRDLLLRQDFVMACQAGLTELAQKVPLPVLVGAPTPNQPHRPFNSAVLCHEGRAQVVANKQLLPNYNVFDEERHFSTDQNRACPMIDFMGHRLLISICEDAWNSLDIEGQPKYPIDPIGEGIKIYGQPDVIINISASPYSITKIEKRERVFTHIAKTHKTPVLLCGQVGGNDQLLFDGHSMIIDKTGQICTRGKMGEADLLSFQHGRNLAPAPARKTDQGQDLLQVLIMGLRDYVNKCRAPGLVLGLSGGIDSAVCLVLAVAALGKDRVRAVYLPSQFSSLQSEIDARALANKLGTSFHAIPIEDAVNSFRHALRKERDAAPKETWDIFDQNIQSRCRGLMIMGIANAYNDLMLTTANKSELAIGYTTIYGDMCGAIAPIGDLYKTQVYQLAHAINKDGEIIPQSIIKKAPTAELKADQKDTDSMPEYDILDSILFRFIDEEKSAQEIAGETGIDFSLIKQTINQINRSEFKRWQAPPSLMVSDKVFRYARRLPIAKNFSYGLA